LYKFSRSTNTSASTPIGSPITLPINGLNFFDSNPARFGDFLCSFGNLFRSLVGH